jgi:hypothetical protein
MKICVEILLKREVSGRSMLKYYTRGTDGQTVVMPVWNHKPVSHFKRGKLKYNNNELTKGQVLSSKQLSRSSAGQPEFTPPPPPAILWRQKRICTMELANSDDDDITVKVSVM